MYKKGNFMRNFSEPIYEAETDTEINTNKIRKRNDTKQLERDQKSNIIFTQSKYNAVDIDIGEYASAHAWIELRNANAQCLVKNFAYNSGGEAYSKFIKNNGKAAIEISKYNNIILPYIGEEIFHVETVKYLFAKFSRGKQKIPVNPNMEYLITLDEKINGEEIWEGLNVLFSNKGKDTLIFSERLKEIENFLKLRYVPSHKIQEVLDEFIRQEIFKKTIEYVDNHNGNWALGIDGKKVRVFPVYDFDFCSRIRNIKIYETLSDNQKTDLKSFIMQYKELPWIKRYISEVIQSFDIQKLIGIASEKTEINIPNEVRVYFEDFYSKKKDILEQIFKEILQQKSKGDDGICI